MFYVVECESSFFFFIFKRRKKTSLYLQLQLAPNNRTAERVLFVASVISLCKSSFSSSSSSSIYPSSSSISFCSLVFHRSRFHSLPPPSVAAISPRTFRTRKHPRNLRNYSRNYSISISGMRICRSGGGNSEVHPLRFGGDSREREIRVLLLSLVDNIADTFRV